MAVEAHLSELTERHRQLDRRIEEEMSRPYTDDLMIQELKRQKLKLKDQIMRIQSDSLH